MTLAYKTAEEAILVIQNKESWHRQVKPLPETQEGLTEFIAVTSNIHPSAWEKLTTYQKAFVLFCLWENLGKNTKILSERRTYISEGIFNSHWEKFYQENQQELLTKQSEIQQPTTEKIEMTIAFETKHYVFGTDASTMTVDQLIEAVKKIEKEIENLESVETKSKTIDNKKAELKAMLKDVVNILDAR